MGTVLGIMFGASSLYLVLKVGLTVSASIPVAVISLALFRMLSKVGFRDATILENNISQTAGSAGESIAFGVGVTMPAIMILGFDLDLTRVLLVSVLGGLLGHPHDDPAAPGADRQGARGPQVPGGHRLRRGADGRRLRGGPGAGLARGRSRRCGRRRRRGSARRPGPRRSSPASASASSTTSSTAVPRLWKDTPEKVFGAPFNGASVSAEISPELLGIGYIIGPRIAALMCGGGVLSYLVLIPMIKFFGGASPGALAPGKMPISAMQPDDVRAAYVLYIGSGAVAAGGIISLFRSIPTIWHGLREGLRDVGLLKSGPRPAMPAWPGAAHREGPSR